MIMWTSIYQLAGQFRRSPCFPMKISAQSPLHSSCFQTLDDLNYGKYELFETQVGQDLASAYIKHPEDEKKQNPRSTLANIRNQNR